MISALLGLSWSGSSFKAKSSFMQLSYNCQSSNTVLKDYSKSSNPSIPSGSRPLPGSWFLLVFINSPAGMVLQPEKPHAFAIGAAQIHSPGSVSSVRKWPCSGPGSGPELSPGLVQDLQLSGSSPGWNCTILLWMMSHPGRLCHPLSSHNPQSWLPVHCMAWATSVPSSPALLTQGRCQPAPGKLLKCSFSPGNQLNSLRDCMLQGLAHSGVNSQQNHSPTPDYLGMLRTGIFLPCGSKVWALFCPQTISKTQCWDPLAHPLWSKHRLIIPAREHCCCEPQESSNRNIFPSSATALPWAGIWRSPGWLQFLCGTAASSLPFPRMWGMCRAELPWTHLGSSPLGVSALCEHEADQVYLYSQHWVRAACQTTRAVVHTPMVMHRLPSQWAEMWAMNFFPLPFPVS